MPPRSSPAMNSSGCDTPQFAPVYCTSKLTPVGFTVSEAPDGHVNGSAGPAAQTRYVPMGSDVVSGSSNDPANAQPRTAGLQLLSVAVPSTTSTPLVLSSATILSPAKMDPVPPTGAFWWIVDGNTCVIV